MLIMILLALLIQNVMDPDQALRNLEIIRAKIMKTGEDLEQMILDEYDDEHEERDTDYRYIQSHYQDRELLAKLRSTSTEHRMFQSEVRDPVWEKLHLAKDSIDPLLLRYKINDHIMALSTEDELSPFEFNMDFVNMEAIKKAGGNLWYNQFEPLSLTIFKRIETVRNGVLPLHVFTKYPFEIRELMDDIENFLEESPDHQKKSLKMCTKEDIFAAMEHLKFLDCADSNERQFIVDTIDTSQAYQVSNNPDNAFFPKFMEYLRQVTSLFQNARKIKNMLRDVRKAIVERGTHCKIVADQVYFLFDDVRDSIVAMPFFRAMRTEDVKDKEQDELLEIWTIRNTLWTLYFLNHATRKKVLRESVRNYVTKEEVCDMVFATFSNEVYLC